MADPEHWHFKNKTEMWMKIVGHAEEHEEESRATASKIFLEAGARCLEIGAGVGRLLKFAPEYFKVAFGVDYSPYMVAAATVYLQYRPDARVILNDGWTLPFPNEYFSLVYSFTCFQHMPELEMIRANLKEAFRVLEQEGTIRFQTVLGKREPGRYDGYVFETPQELYQEVLDAGFYSAVLYVEGEWVWLKARKEKT